MKHIFTTTQKSNLLISLPMLFKFGQNNHKQSIISSYCLICDMSHMSKATNNLIETKLEHFYS